MGPRGSKFAGSMSVPAERITRLNDEPPRPAGEYVLYWMTAFRRPHHNFALDRAIELAAELKRPLFVLEALRIAYPDASERLHAFVVDGMRDNAAAFERAGVRYEAYLEPEPGAGKGLIEALAAHAASVVTDDYPSFFLPRMLASVAPKLGVRFEKIDSNGILPLRATDRVFLRAVDFRRFVQRVVFEHGRRGPRATPFRSRELPTLGKLPKSIRERWPFLSSSALASPERLLRSLPIDRTPARTALEGGARAAETTLRAFVKQRLAVYADARNDPDAHATSGLSPYLHFGHVSAHQVFDAILRAEDFAFDAVDESRLKKRGARDGFWQMQPSAEAFLDQLVVWRELGFNFCHHRPNDYSAYESLPAWAQKTLSAHAADRKPVVYSREQLERAETHDPIWNAAQRELVRDGRIHNYLRMLWGKKVLEWTPSPQAALQILLELNDRYALDGRDPNSYSGIAWCFGRYDRPWGPERQTFGLVRYMSSESTNRKLRLKSYLERYGVAADALGAGSADALLADSGSQSDEPSRSSAR